ncbi:hypothetical protein M0R45_017504 [Rubus argutus]|uniref:LysM domain-containing protein n=1 Tax=Rubus argutus TaxID=59490 RepID=A0AAW1XWB5_RUBAR
MAKSSNKMALALNLILVISLMISISECKKHGVGTDGFDADCNSVYGAEFGDSCNSVVEKFGLSSLDFFLSINPNCNCDAFFEGQWLCVDGNPNE